jgi:hypothetical protein
MESVTVTIDVTDWAEKALKGERFPQTEEEFVEMAVEMGAKNVARIVEAGRILGLVPDDIIPPDKDLYDAGGAAATHAMIGAQTYRVEHAGKLIKMRKYRAVQKEEPDEEIDGETLETSIEDALPDHG